VTWVWIAAGAAVVVIAVGALVPVLGGRRAKSLRSNDEAIAARSKYNQLAHYLEVDTTSDADFARDAEALALLRTARERWNTAGSTLASASTEADFELAESVAKEGLAAVAQAYARIGREGPLV
jgi:hypothetical protein